VEEDIPLRHRNLVCLIAIFALVVATAGLASASSVTLKPLQPGSALASDVTTTVPFPAAGDAYYSATNGSGTIPVGGMTAYQWTAGDWVESAIFTLPTTSVTDLTADWIFQDYLGGGNTETWNAYVNGQLVGFTTLPDCDYCGTNYTVTGTVNFAGIAPVAGGYQIELILQNTVPGGGGSVAWVDGGTTGLSYASAIPEPGSVALLGLGLVGLSGMLRRKLRRQ
jgi:hypothetical protein